MNTHLKTNKLGKKLDLNAILSPMKVIPIHVPGAKIAVWGLKIVMKPKFWGFKVDFYGFYGSNAGFYPEDFNRTLNRV